MQIQRTDNLTDFSEQHVKLIKWLTSHSGSITSLDVSIKWIVYLCAVSVIDCMRCTISVRRYPCYLSSVLCLLLCYFLHLGSSEATLNVNEFFTKMHENMNCFVNVIERDEVLFLLSYTMFQRRWKEHLLWLQIKRQHRLYNTSFIHGLEPAYTQNVLHCHLLLINMLNEKQYIFYLIILKL